MTNRTLAFKRLCDAVYCAVRRGTSIYCEVESLPGKIVQVYPGGRTIAWPDTPRYRKRLNASGYADACARLLTTDE